jgi:Zn-dependent alcohol dehydrogenase
MKTRAAVLRKAGTARLPMVGGHEGAGVVVEAGPGVTRVKVGDRARGSSSRRSTSVPPTRSATRPRPPRCPSASPTASSLFGGANPLYDIPMILSRWNEGHIKLSELITKRYSLDEINEGMKALCKAGTSAASSCTSTEITGVRKVKARKGRQ